MKILLAVDGSDYSIRAAQYLLGHLDWFKEKAELHLLHVHAPLPAGRISAAVGEKALQQYYREEAEEQLAPTLALLQNSQIACQSGFRVGKVETEINDYASQHAIDLIVMGSHGRTGLKNIVMGSVASKILASAKVPVLIVR